MPPPCSCTDRQPRSGARVIWLRPPSGVESPGGQRDSRLLAGGRCGALPDRRQTRLPGGGALSQRADRPRLTCDSATVPNAEHVGGVGMSNGQNRQTCRFSRWPTRREIRQLCRSHRALAFGQVAAWDFEAGTQESSCGWSRALHMLRLLTRSTGNTTRTNRRKRLQAAVRRVTKTRERAAPEIIEAVQREEVSISAASAAPVTQCLVLPAGAHDHNLIEYTGRGHERGDGQRRHRQASTGVYVRALSQ